MVTYERIDAALQGQPVWDLGQLEQVEIDALNRAVRAGKLCKARASWQGISPLKTVWFVPGHEPWEVMAQRRAA